MSKKVVFYAFVGIATVAAAVYCVKNMCRCKAK